MTPFGDRGPGADWAAADIVCWASGGMMFLTGLPGRPPLQIRRSPRPVCTPGRRRPPPACWPISPGWPSGQGQKVVVDTQACVVWTLMVEQAFPVLHGDYLKRTGRCRVPTRAAGRCGRAPTARWPSSCWEDPSRAGSSRALVEWMVEENAAPAWLDEIDFADWTPARFMGDGDADREFIELTRRAEAAVQAVLQQEDQERVVRGGFATGGSCWRRWRRPRISPRTSSWRPETTSGRYATTSVGRDLPVLGRFARFGRVRTGEVGPAPPLGPA